MKTDSKGIELIKKYESLHDGDLKMIGLQPKMCPAGIWTEGYGRAMRNDKGLFVKGAENRNLAFSKITINTEKEAMLALEQDLKIYENIVIRNVKVTLTQNQFNALVSYVYNTGGSSTLYSLINTKATKAKIQNWFETKYISAGGVTLPGLVKRRKEESNLYFS